ncbi:glycosyltransferase involved in cell wall biosynthesis [Amycolatopsis bartoniae]|uniref:Glycosyl hydrolase n=1 Tax=Amycolatopsis bartoniae TaxID=941986 RepID=A0A8H9MDZ8_9PSEU|nr:glycosyltransferase family A protein [Amycolatopsis bartoniae]MBB2936616.1 glycosyltransferase involved in cell wall biosynthesis [Amycolatopsis bartoniae]TVT09798.1 glycosyltransferase family 2 protein [Amycolatopsis bartoniae]GHF67642.1 glycosyl hydrolase [Amycolatopsis bartoniae]
MKVDISVCVPAYQAERYLAGTLRSVLAQSFRNFELVVVDNASTDRTARILAEFRDPRLRVVRNDTVLPVAENWNRAVAESRAPLVKLVCADDLLHPRCLEWQHAVLTRDPGLALVCGRRTMVNEQSRPMSVNRGLRGLLGKHASEDVIRRVVRHGGNPLGEPAGALFRRADFDAVGGFDGRWKFPMDLALWVRLLERGDFYGMRQSVAAFRISRGSLTDALDDSGYAEQRTLTEELAATPEWQVRRRDRLVGAAKAPGARLRRQALFLVARAQGERAERDVTAAAHHPSE